MRVCSSSPSPHWFEHWPLCQFPVSHSNVLRGANRQNRRTPRLTPGEGKDGARRGEGGERNPPAAGRVADAALAAFRLPFPAFAVGDRRSVGTRAGHWARPFLSPGATVVAAVGPPAVEAGPPFIGTRAGVGAGLALCFLRLGLAGAERVGHADPVRPLTADRPGPALSPRAARRTAPPVRAPSSRRPPIAAARLVAAGLGFRRGRHRDPLLRAFARRDRLVILADARDRPGSALRAAAAFV